MVACAGAAYWMLTDDSFTLDGPLLAGDLHYTDTRTILAAAGVGDGQHPNVVRLRTDEMRSAIMSFPAIAEAQVTTALPDHVSISVAERVPLFAIEHAGARFLVDSDGLVLVSIDLAAANGLGLPTVDDQRTQFVPAITVGGQVDPIDLAAILELGAVTPALIDSSATSLSLTVGDEDGFVVRAQPNGWQAIFGQYTPNLRPTDLIPRQVQCLRSLLGANEPNVRTIYLAPLDDRCGTYLPVQPSRATPTPAPAR